MSQTSQLSRKRILVVGSGAREHALAWKLSLAEARPEIFVAPGNDGMDPSFVRWPLESGDGAFARLAARAREEGISLAVIGPDAALAEGAADAFSGAGIPVFGPQRAAAQLEWSKAFAKEVMEAAGVPTARYFRARGEEEALSRLRSLEWSEGPVPPARQWVLKADGLALGKGVVVCASLKEAEAALPALLRHGPELVIEERLFGEEISWHALSDGTDCRLLEPARDHKRLLDGDQGPNTGGMGAFSPVPGLPSHWADRVRREVFEPVLAEMRKRGTPFQGVLFAGLMVDPARDTIHVIEFNARFGDPECEVLMDRWEGDVLPWLEACASGSLSRMPERVVFRPETSVLVFVAAPGYPESPERGLVFAASPPAAPAAFCAGVRRSEGRWVTSGGRVIGVMGRGRDLSLARADAYSRIESVRFPRMHFRHDIGASRPSSEAKP